MELEILSRAGNYVIISSKKGIYMNTIYIKFK